MTRQNAEPLPNILTFKEAAEVLGVSQPTLRRWDESGKFRARRHPINGYRLYDRAKVLAMRKKIWRIRVLRGSEMAGLTGSA